MPSGIAAVCASWRAAAARRPSPPSGCAVRAEAQEGADHHADHQDRAAEGGVARSARSAVSAAMTTSDAAAHAPTHRSSSGHVSRSARRSQAPGLGGALGRRREPIAAPGAAACPWPAPPRPSASHRRPCPKARAAELAGHRSAARCAARVISRLTTPPASAEEQRHDAGHPMHRRRSAPAAAARDQHRRRPDAAGGRTSRHAASRSPPAPRWTALPAGRPRCAVHSTAVRRAVRRCSARRRRTTRCCAMTTSSATRVTTQ